MGPELERLGGDGWEGVLVLKREANYVHVLFKRPKQPEFFPPRKVY